MKSLISIFIITLIGLSSARANFRDSDTNSTTVDTIRAFFDGLGLDTIDDFVLDIYKDVSELKQLFKDLMDDLKKEVNVVNVGESISKAGLIINLAGTHVKTYANNTRLYDQLNIIRSYVSKLISDPNKFINKVIQNVQANMMIIGWEIVDLQKLIQVKDFVKFGQRLGNLVASILKGANEVTLVQNNHLRKLASISYECVKAVYEFVYHVANLIMKGDVSSDDLLKAFFELCNGLRNCSQ
jgi:hypothetical protein